MDRALDIEQLNIALGRHDNLPTPEELSGIIADAELQLLLQKEDIEDKASWDVLTRLVSVLEL